jgi:hypothetical protein
VTKQTSSKIHGLSSLSRSPSRLIALVQVGTGVVAIVRLEMTLSPARNTNGSCLPHGGDPAVPKPRDGRGSDMPINKHFYQLGRDVG